MSISLKFNKVEGLTFQQQSFTKGEDGGWKNDPTPVEEDRHPRRLDAHGHPEKLGTFQMHITAGTKNLVLTKKGPVTHVDFRNTSLRNQLRIKTQVLTDRKVLENGKGAVRKDWVDSGAPVFVPPNTFSGAFVGDGQRAILDEMPT